MIKKVYIVSFLFILFLSFNLKASEATQLGTTAASTLTTVLGNEASIALTTKSFNKKCKKSGEKFPTDAGFSCTGIDVIETLTCKEYTCICEEPKDETCQKEAKKLQRECRNLCRTKKNMALALGITGASASALVLALDKSGEADDSDDDTSDTSVLTCDQTKQSQTAYKKCLCEESGGAYDAENGLCYTDMASNDPVAESDTAYGEEESYSLNEEGESVSSDDSTEEADDTSSGALGGSGTSSIAKNVSNANKEKSKKDNSKDLKHETSSSEAYATASNSASLSEGSSKTLSLEDKKVRADDGKKDIANTKEDIFEMVETKYKTAYMAQRIQDSFFSVEKFKARIKGRKK